MCRLVLRLVNLTREHKMDNVLIPGLLQLMEMQARLVGHIPVFDSLSNWDVHPPENIIVPRVDTVPRVTRQSESSN